MRNNLQCSHVDVRGLGKCAKREWLILRCQGEVYLEELSVSERDSARDTDKA